ncbi:MAG: DUF4402 domain-containing protein [Bacteroidales bacterium]|nr:DUF4402 domain-containing protein [Bacteroidales bacterium]
MKSITKIITLSIIALGFSTASFAQVGATATATGTIVAPIAIVKVVDLNFGNIAVSATGGTVILAPAGTRTITGGVTLPAVIGDVTAAEFTVTGSIGYTYAISLPTTPTTVTSEANTMTVDAFTSTPNSTGTLTGGTETVKVGATINVSANQAAGTYTSATPFTVTVNYN